MQLRLFDEAIPPALAGRAEPRDCGHETPCWLWQGWRYASGYGGIGIGGQQYLAHRWAYEAMVGPIPDGLSIDHLCFTKLCVNPAHLEPVTLAENTRRQAAAGRQVVAGPARENAAKTHCLRGHAFTAENTLVCCGRRRCRQCGRERARRLRAHKR